VTTALELESGVLFLREWLAGKQGKTIVNYGASVPHGALRAMAMGTYSHYFAQAQEIIRKEGLESLQLSKLGINLARANYMPLEDHQMEALRTAMEYELQAGALGIGVPVGYYPGARPGEIFKVYSYAAEKKAIVFSHTRGFGMPGIQEAIANATASGAPLHIVHANSLSLADIQVTLDMVAAAQTRGLDITTEVYPYTAASTSIESAIFDEGWQEKLGVSYGDIQWEASGERLSEASFQRYRKQGGVVIMHMMKPEWIKAGIQDPRTLIASDGMPYAPGAHPRTAGTFSRGLGKYVREENTIGLMEALSKMKRMTKK
jgi:N-acyl-D-aspartate/D-glutamate deacylase